MFKWWKNLCKALHDSARCLLGFKVRTVQYSHFWGMWLKVSEPPTHMLPQGKSKSIFCRLCICTQSFRPKRDCSDAHTCRHVERVRHFWLNIEQACVCTLPLPVLLSADYVCCLFPSGWWMLGDLTHRKWQKSVQVLSLSRAQVQRPVDLLRRSKPPPRP